MTTMLYCGICDIEFVPDEHVYTIYNEDNTEKTLVCERCNNRILFINKNNNRKEFKKE